MPLSIRWRLTLGIAIALIVTLAAILVTLRLALGGILEADLDGDLSRDAGLVSARVVLHGSLEDQRGLQEIVDSFSAGGPTSGFIVVIRDRAGGVLASTAGVDAEAWLPDPGEIRSVLEGDVHSRTVEVGESKEVRLRTSRLTIGREVVGIIQVGEDAEATTRPLERLQTILLAEGIGGAVLAVIIAFWLARGAVRPIEDVIGVATTIEASDLQRRIGASGSPPEVQKLADAFDAMLGRIEAAFQQQRDFVLDVSHELRTPLTALRGNLDVMLMDDRMDEETRSHFERMSGEVGRLIRLTSNLLYLAHADAGRELAHEPVELDVLCLEVYRQARGIRSGAKLRLEHEDQVTVQGDRDLLKQLVLNVVDNSLKYTPAGGVVTLSLYRDDRQARIVVSDTGPGISPEQIPLIFQRFYRGAGGKGHGGGAGIGLAISKWIAEAHGGRIEVASQVGKGSKFTIILPLNAAPQKQDTERL
jgi:two-component system OmpR family sensor kinase